MKKLFTTILLVPLVSAVGLTARATDATEAELMQAAATIGDW